MSCKQDIRQDLEEPLALEIVKQMAESSVRMRKMSVKTPWRGRLLPKRKKRLY
jgi:hypothetical protein